MKDIVLKSLVVLPIIAFVDYIIMIVIGYAGVVFGFKNTFYECTFCTIAKIVFTVSLLAFLFMIIMDVVPYIKKRKQLS